MNIQKLNKEQKVSLLKAMAAGKITKKQIAKLKELEKLFVEFRTHDPVEFSIEGNRVNEDEFYRRLEIARTILGDEVVHVRLIHDGQE
jgi:hypothetical protein